MASRRVATGTTPDGRSFVARDEIVEPVTVAALPGYAWHRLWGFDELPTDAADVGDASPPAHFPPPGAARFNLFTVPPASTHRPALTDETRAELEHKLPGRAARMESDLAGMHRTASVDLIVVLSGRVTLELDDDVTVDLNAGDTLVQNGTRHAWRNNSGEPCTLAIVLIGVGGANS